MVPKSYLLHVDVLKWLKGATVQRFNGKTEYYLNLNLNLNLNLILNLNLCLPNSFHLYALAPFRQCAKYLLYVEYFFIKSLYVPK
jgi:hypothetical protein